MLEDRTNIHLSLRPAEPEHPMSLEGGVVDGDTALMFRCLVEELLLSGLSPAQLRGMSRDRNYQALYAARVALGDIAVDEVFDRAGAQVGIHRHSVCESADRFQTATLTISARTAGEGRREGA